MSIVRQTRNKNKIYISAYFIETIKTSFSETKKQNKDVDEDGEDYTKSGLSFFFF